MKFYKNIFIALMFAGSVCSCEDTILTQVNQNTITDGLFWKTQSDFTKALNALYSSLQLPAVSGQGLSFDMQRSDLAGTESYYNNDFTQLKWTNNTGYVKDRWSQLYVGVFRANQMLHYIDNATFMSESERNLYIAQAKFLRGYCYFWLAYTYNGAVIQSELPTTPSEMHKPFSPRQEVIDNMVIPDLEYAQKTLPKQWDKANIGKFTWGAATAMLGKVFLFQKDWAKAKEYFGEIIKEAENNGLYSLMPNFMDNFTTDAEFNSESVLEVAFSDNYKPGTGTGIGDQDETSGSEAVGIASALASIMGAGGYNTVLPTYHCQEMFVSGEQMDPKASWTKTHVRSMRTYATIAVEFGDGDYYHAPLTPYTDASGKTVPSRANFNYGQGSKVKKWTQWDRVDTEDSNTGCRTGINYRAIRYADILLMYAEATLEADGENGVKEAIKYIDQVRKRAQVITLQEYIDNHNGEIPKLDVSKFANQLKDYPYVPANRNNILHHLRMVERPLELAFEGQRWYDLVRWGLVKEAFDQGASEEKKIRKLLIGDENEESTKDQNQQINIGKIYPLYLNERVRSDFAVADKVYTPELKDYFPIPSCETENNETMKNNSSEAN